MHLPLRLALTFSWLLRRPSTICVGAHLVVGSISSAQSVQAWASPPTSLDLAQPAWHSSSTKVVFVVPRVLVVFFDDSTLSTFFADFEKVGCPALVVAA